MAKTNIQSAPRRGNNPYNVFGRTHDGLWRAQMASNPTAENRALLADLERLEADLSDTRKWSDIPNEERPGIRDSMLHELQMAHWQRCTQRKEKLSAEFESFRASWERQHRVDGSERLANMARYKTEIKLNPKKAESDLYEAASADTPEARAKFDADYLYALAEHTANEGKSGSLEVAKGALSNCNVSQPWINTEKGDLLAKEIGEVSLEYGTAAVADGLVCDVAELVAT